MSRREVQLLDVVVGWESIDSGSWIVPPKIGVGDVQRLRSKRETLNMEDEPMDLEMFTAICSSFLQATAQADIETIFRAFDVLDEGRVTLKFFVLAYQYLCDCSTDWRAKLVYYMAKKSDEDMLDFDSLVRALVFINLCASRLKTAVPLEPLDAVESLAAGMLERFGADREFRELCRPDPIDKPVKTSVMMWIDAMSRFSVDENDLDLRQTKELELISLEIERMGYLLQEDSALQIDCRSSFDGEPQSFVNSPLVDTPKRTFTDRVRGPVIQLRKTKSAVALDLPFSIDFHSLKWKGIIGRGAVASVWNAEWLHMPVAVKVLHGHLGGADDNATGPEAVEETYDPETGQDFLQEIEMLTQLRHPNVLLCMGACVTIGKPFCIVTELYHGGSIHELLHGPTARKLSREQVLELAIEIARGMLYLHSSTPTILHRDLKSNNILVDKHISHCVICDFGLSRLADLGQLTASLHGGKEQTRDAGGTPYTMAPEVMDGEPYTTAADVYSFGIVVWEMWTGKVPFEGLQPIQLMFQVYAEGARPPITPEDNMDPIIEQLIVRCWDEVPSARPTFEEILDDLESEDLKQVVGLSRNASSRSFENSAGLMSAVSRGQLDRVQELTRTSKNVNVKDYDKRTPLHIAAAEKRPEIVKFLIESGADVNAKDRWGSTPLNDAYLSNCDGAVELLLTAGATDDPAQQREIKTVDSQEDTEMKSLALMTAIFRRDIAGVKKLLGEGADPRYRDYDHRTPLHLAASEGYADIGFVLCQHNVDFYARDRWGSTPLLDAQRAGHEDIRLVIEVAAHQADRNGSRST